MRKVIGGAVYDNDTSERLFSTSDHGIEFYEALHRTKSGKYFIYRLVGDAGEIMPISRKRAIIWAFGTNASERDIKRAFGASDETGTKQVSLRLPLHTYHILRQAAAEQGISMAAYVEALVLGANPQKDEAEAAQSASETAPRSEEDQRLAYLEGLPERELYTALSEERNLENERLRKTRKQFKDQRKRVKKMSEQERDTYIGGSVNGAE